MKKSIGIGFVGGGFITRFHIQSLIGVRNCEVLGVMSRTKSSAEESAALARTIGVGEAKAFETVFDMVADPNIDAIWICAPNFTRIEIMEEIVDSIENGKGELIGVTCEKPLGRNVKEAKKVLELTRRVGLLDGYLENQVFAPSVTRGKEIIWSRGAKATGRPYLARAAVDQLAFKKAFGLFRYSSFAVLVLASLAISIIHQIYFLQTGPFLSSIGILDSQIGPAMTIGQFAEILTMAYLGYFLKNIGFKKVITIGIAAYCLRYAIFGSESLPVWIIVLSQAFHGFCYAFFFAAAYIYVDKIADEDVRHSAQTVFGIIILGGGPVIGGWLSGFLQSANTVNNVFNFSTFWYTLSLIGFITTVLFFMFFKEELAERE